MLEDFALPWLCLVAQGLLQLLKMGSKEFHPQNMSRSWRRDVSSLGRVLQVLKAVCIASNPRLFPRALCGGNDAKESRRASGTGMAWVERKGKEAAGLLLAGPAWAQEPVFMPTAAKPAESAEL